MTMPPVHYQSLPPECFPVTLIAYRKSDDVEVWRAVIDAGSPLYVPPLILEHGPVHIRVEFADGDVYDPR